MDFLGGRNQRVHGRFLELISRGGALSAYSSPIRDFLHSQFDLSKRHRQELEAVLGHAEQVALLNYELLFFKNAVGKERLGFLAKNHLAIMAASEKAYKTSSSNRRPGAFTSDVVPHYTVSGKLVSTSVLGESGSVAHARSLLEPFIRFSEKTGGGKSALEPNHFEIPSWLSAAEARMKQIALKSSGESDGRQVSIKVRKLSEVFKKAFDDFAEKAGQAYLEAKKG